MILSELAPVISAQHGLFYTKSTDSSKPVFKLTGTYAFKERKNLSNVVYLGEGLVGQSILEKRRILLTQVPGDYIKISSGLGEASPLNIVVLPVTFEGEVLAAIEIASFNRFNEIQLSFLEQLVETMGIVLNTIGATMRTEELLRESQAMSEELQNQQAELQGTNEELEQKARELEEQKEAVEAKNRDIEIARHSLEEQAEQLTLTSKYKSEFLTNMSHELRTPLNSQLILAQLLADNKEGNLTEKQIEFAQTIHASGADLLNLINEILDLSKIESGTMALDIDRVNMEDLCENLKRGFHQVAKEKDLVFDIQMDEKLPEEIYTDKQRLQQVLKNLLSNAFKFTEEGKVSLKIEEAVAGWNRQNRALDAADYVIAFRVSDTGIGISKDKHKIIFEAFQQVDGTTTRKYGGTGLGLTISREVAQLLNGELSLTASAPGAGSTFTLYLPQSEKGVSKTSNHKRPDSGGLVPDKGSSKQTAALPKPPKATSDTLLDQTLSAPSTISDDRNKLNEGDTVLLVIEDDEAFAKILLELAHEHGFKGLVSPRGETGLVLAREYQPDAITLDINLPSMNGWAVLDGLKHDPLTRHIPVHIISVEGERLRGLKYGAVGVLSKPASRESLDEVLDGLMAYKRRPKSLLVIEDEESQRDAIVALIGGQDIEIVAVGSAEEALTAIEGHSFDCIVLDLRLPEMTGFALLKKMRDLKSWQDIPVIVYTGKELTRREETQLYKMAQTIIIKSALSPERLLDETALFLHRVEGNLPDGKRLMLQKARQIDPTFVDKKVLLVDDDMRNLFAVTSLLEQQGIEVLYAENGKEGLTQLHESPDIDLVLMDIMMPEMDGYEAMRRIRQEERFVSLPVIALTAKAMKGDREKCIQAGASDYVSKPVDTNQLLSLLRVWLYQ